MICIFRGSYTENMLIYMLHECKFIFILFIKPKYMITCSESYEVMSHVRTVFVNVKDKI